MFDDLHWGRQGTRLSPAGYNASFFKRTWHLTGEEITEAIKEFFVRGRMLGVMNATAIALVPKGEKVRLHLQIIDQLHAAM